MTILRSLDRQAEVEICDVLITDEKPSGDLIRQLKHSRPDMEIVVCED